MRTATRRGSIGAMRIRPPHLVAVALAAAVCLPPAAHGASLVYRDASGNVAVARPDGGAAKRVTTDADSANPQAPVYSPPSADDAGGIVMSRKGYGDAPFVMRRDQDGRLLHGPFLFDMPLCSSVSPFRSAIDPSGTFVAFVYVHGNSCGPPMGFEVRTKLTAAKGPTVGSPYGAYSDLTEPRWLRHPAELLAGRQGDTIRVWQSVENPVLVDWLTLDPGTAAEWDIDSFDIHPTQPRMLMEQSPEGAPAGGERRDMLVLTYTNPPGPTSVPTSVCTLDGLVASSTSPSRPRYSPDGSQIAWNAPDGIHVSPAPAAGPGGVCTLTPRLAVPGGRDVEWARFVVTAPPGGGGGGGGGGGSSPGGAKPTPGGKLVVKLPAKPSRAAFRAGLALRVTAPKAGRITATAKMTRATARRRGIARRAAKAVVVARGAARAARPGTVTLTLAPTAKARAAWKRLAGVRLTIEIRQGGRTVRRAVTLKR